MIIKCECGSNTFFLEGVYIVAICTKCGFRTYLETNLYELRRDKRNGTA